MVAVLAAAEEADADLARVLTAATGGDPELPAEQGTADGQSLQDGQLTPEEAARLEENTTLTPEQQEALVRGDLVLPASQMEYLNNLSRSLDGKSPAEIRAMIDQLNQQRHRTAAPSPTRCSCWATRISPPPAPTRTLSPATSAMCPRKAACRTCRRVSGKRSSVRCAGPSCRHKAPTSKAIRRSKCPTREHPFPELDNYRDVAAIVSAGDPALQQGTAMDAALLDKSEQILHGMHSSPYIPWAENVDMSQRLIDPAVQDMLSAADVTRWPCTGR